VLCAGTFDERSLFGQRFLGSHPPQTMVCASRPPVSASPERSRAVVSGRTKRLPLYRSPPRVQGKRLEPWDAPDKNRTCARGLGNVVPICAEAA
jgi:hypothetical protein